MGRSVSTPSNTFAVCYQSFDCEDEYDCSHEWDWFVENIQYRVKEAWPSMEECDKWLDREDHAIMENTFAYIGVSEYCGLVSVWMVSKKEEMLNTGYDDDASRANLADQWCSMVHDKFHKMFDQYRKVATFSNGEAVFQEV